MPHGLCKVDLSICQPAVDVEPHEIWEERFVSGEETFLYE